MMSIMFVFPSNICVFQLAVLKRQQDVVPYNDSMLVGKRPHSHITSERATNNSWTIPRYYFIFNIPFTGDIFYLLR